VKEILRYTKNNDSCGSFLLPHTNAAKCIMQGRFCPFLFCFISFCFWQLRLISYLSLKNTGNWLFCHQLFLDFTDW